MQDKNHYRRQLRCTVADFSIGRMPTYEIDSFPTPEGTLGIKLFPEVTLGIGEKATKTGRSTNIYWLCKHLEDCGWLVKECFTGAVGIPTVKPKLTNNVVVDLGYNNFSYSPTWTIITPQVQCSYIIVRKVDETDIEKTKK